MWASMWIMGKCLGLLGLNGAGKATLISILATRLPPLHALYHEAPALLERRIRAAVLEARRTEGGRRLALRHYS